MKQSESPASSSWVRPFSAFPALRVPSGAVCRWGDRRVGVALRPDWSLLFAELRGLGPLDLVTGNLCVQSAVHALYPLLNHDRDAGLCRSSRGDCVFRPGAIAAAYAVEECVGGEYFYSIDLFRRGGHCLQRVQLSPDSDPLRWPLLIGSLADAEGSDSIPSDRSACIQEPGEGEDALIRAWNDGLCDGETVFWRDDLKPGSRLAWLPRLGREAARRFPAGLVSEFLEYLLGIRFDWRFHVLNGAALSFVFRSGDGPRFFCRRRGLLSLGAAPYALRVDCRLLKEAWLVKRSDGKLALELYGDGGDPAALLHLAEFDLHSLPAT